MEDKRASKLFGRRESLHLLGVGLAAGSFLGLAACKDDKSAASGGGASPSPAPAAPPADTAPAAPLTCDTPIEPASKTTRMVMQYKNPAAVPEKSCSACTQFMAGKYGDCGGCKLFTGPVNPKGGCLSFAPANPNGAPAAAPAKSG